MNRFAVILTHNRPELLAQCVAAIGPQVDMVIVVDNASDPPAQVATGDSWCTVLLQIPDQPPNLARFWTLGIRTAMNVYDASQHLAPAHIAVLCDDAIAPPGWYAAVVEAMTASGAVVGCSDPWNSLPAGQTRMKHEPDGMLGERMPGHAWILDPLSPVRPDESMLLWWCDTDIDWQARKAGGMVMVGGYPVPNAMPSGFMLTHPELIHQTGLDGEAFVRRWGWKPW